MFTKQQRKNSKRQKIKTNQKPPRWVVYGDRSRKKPF